MTKLILLGIVLSFSTVGQAQSPPGARTTQQSVGELRLEVKDPSGREIEATGKLQSLTTGLVQDFQSDAQGRYTFKGLAYGRYHLEVSREGFATQSVLINVQSKEPIMRNVTLAL